MVSACSIWPRVPRNIYETNQELAVCDGVSDFLQYIFKSPKYSCKIAICRQTFIFLIHKKDYIFPG